MTEAEWLACTDPQKMLEYLRDTESEQERRLRQFAVGCCYRIWHLMPDEGKRLLEMAEQFGEGTVTRHQRDSAVAAYRAVHGRFGADTPALRAAYRCKNMAIDAFTANIVADYTAEATGNAADSTARSRAYAAAFEGERVIQVTLLHCIFGNPFRPFTINPSWLTWHDSLLVSMARQMYESRDFSDMPILADALEEAGCSDPDILNHCRQPGEHVRGCWVVDALLGKS